jgi:hypothetical protein
MEQASPLARRPYDLRHACLSTWLNGGVYPTQLTEWAGHGVDVLLRIYAKCVVGQDELAKRPISNALRQDSAESRSHKRSWTLARIWHSDLHPAALDRTQPHTVVTGKITDDESLRRSDSLDRHIQNGGAGGARTHDRRIMRSTASCTMRASCTDDTEPCRRWP